MIINPLHSIDFYKSGHIYQYPKGTTKIYSNFTARSNKYSPISSIDDGVIFFGLQGFIKEILIENWRDNFFNLPLEKVIKTYQRRMDTSLGKGTIKTDHIEALHKLGYLPLSIKALPEGELIPIKIPLLTITNTHPDFYWLVNYLETNLSNYLWKPITIATIAYYYKRAALAISRRANTTNTDYIDFQCHDFSCRGMGSEYDAARGGAAHLLSFKGTDTVSAIDYLETYYNADCEKELIGGSVPATEHSVMCAGSKEDEFNTVKRLITETYPTGIVSIVADTWNLWEFIDKIIKPLKEEILKREGKVVIRPDSGNPRDILLGKGDEKGVLERLWEIFGGSCTTDSESGIRSRVICPKIGVIYGDSITYDIATSIWTHMLIDSWSPENIVFGVGSYTYQYITRDSYGFAMKATYAEIEGKGRNLFKDPITDDGMKRSACGLMRVRKESDGYKVYGYKAYDNQTIEQEEMGELREVYRDGKLKYETSLSEMRNRIKERLQ